MLALLPIIQKLILEYMTKKTHEGFSLNFQAMALFAAAGLMGLLFFIFSCLAFKTYLTNIYGEAAGWLITAGAVLLLGIIFYSWACYSKKHKAIMHKVKEEVEDRFSPLASIIEQLAEPVKDHPVAAVILAGLAGVMAGDKLHPHGYKRGTES